LIILSWTGWDWLISFWTFFISKTVVPFMGWVWETTTIQTEKEELSSRRRPEWW
jgi:hypothetical protein